MDGSTYRLIVGVSLYCKPKPALADHCIDGFALCVSRYIDVESVMRYCFILLFTGILSVTPAEPYADNFL